MSNLTTNEILHGGLTQEEVGALRPTELAAYKAGNAHYDEEVTFISVDSYIHECEWDECPDKGKVFEFNNESIDYTDSDGNNDSISTNYEELENGVYMDFDYRDLKAGDRLIFTWIGFGEDGEWCGFDVTKIRRAQ